MLDAVLLERFDTGEDVTNIACESRAESEIQHEHKSSDRLEDIPYTHRLLRHLMQDERQQQYTRTDHKCGTEITPRYFSLAYMLYFFRHLTDKTLYTTRRICGGLHGAVYGDGNRSRVRALRCPQKSPAHRQLASELSAYALRNRSP